MKTNIIQKLCLFIILATLNCVVWAQEVTFDAVDYSRGDPITRIKKDNVVTIEFTKSQISSHLISSKRRFRLKGGGTMTVSVAPGYRIREIYCIENTSKGVYLTSGTNGYEASHDEKKLYYRKLYSWDAPSASVLCKNSSRKDDCEFRFIRIRYVDEGNVNFFKHEHLAYVTSPPFKAGLVLKGHTGNQHYRSSNTNVAEVGNDGTITPKHVGTATISVSLDATIAYAKVECSTKVFVKRDNVTFYLNGLENFMLSKGSNAGRALPNAFSFVKTLTASNTEFRHNNPGFSITSSNPEVIRVTDAKEGNLAFGGTTGKATLTFRQEETDLYDAHSFSQEFIVVRTDENNTVLIKDKNEWEMFAFMVNEVGLNALNARLEADINLGSDIVMMGRGGHKYAGTFNGNGHSITMNWTGDNIAPFNLVEDATFMNLRTKGQITARNEFASGLILEAYVSCSVSNCVSEVNIKCEGNNRAGSAGFIKKLKTSAKVTFDDCISAGTFTGSTGAAKEGWAGFVRYNNGECKLNNCLYIGTNNANKDSYTFAPNAKAKNCYYRDACGDAQGDQITTEQLKSGEITYKLQANRNTLFWGQELNKDDEPLLTNNAAKKVYKVDFTYNNQVKTTRYATHDKAIYGSLPTLQDITGTNYNPHHYYNFSFEGSFSASTPINADCKVGITLEEKDYYEIASKDNWKEFSKLVGNGQNAVAAKMTANVNLEGDIVTVGGGSKEYAGTFDGQGYSLTLNWDAGSDNWRSPFYSVENATIKNLRVEGYIKSNGKGHAGLIQNAKGTVTVSGCVSDVNITCSTNEDACKAAGMIQWTGSNSKVTFNDCAVKGSINATEAGRKGISGFVYNQSGNCTFNNCLYIGNADGSSWSVTFSDNPTLNNCYYLSACGKAQGKQVNLVQLKNGEVTKLLQDDRKDACHWAQRLGEMPDLYSADHKSKTNYIYYDRDKWACDDFRLTDGQPLPIGLDFIAAKATYERNLSSEYTATICLPYELPISNSGFDAVYTLSGGQGNNVYFKKVNDKIKAYHPYYIRAFGWSKLKLNGNNIRVKAYKADDLKQPAGTFSFVGTVDGVSNTTAAADNAYILQDDGKFHKVTTEKTEAVVPPYRAYITTSSAGARMLDIILNGETTGINGAETIDDGTVRYYDLQGRYIGNTLKGQPNGLYIGNGKKVMKK